MRIISAMRLGWAVTGVLLAGTVAMAQGPSADVGPGNGAGPGFGEHRPPMERAFGPQGDRGRWWNNPKVVERLKLTDEQRKTFDSILLEHREKLIDLRGGVEKAELEMEPLMGAEQPNEAKILAQIDKVAQARAELEKANARFLLAIRARLTPEQWKQLQADRANHEQPRGGWGAGRGTGADRPESSDRKPGGQFHHQAAPLPPPPPPSTGGADAAPGAGAGDEQ